MTVRDVLISALISVCLLELSLRVQQKLGPLIDLELSPASMVVDASDELNHVHPLGLDWDRNGIRRMDEPNSQSCSPRILFLGDSFMEGLGPRDTTPYHVREAFRSRGQDVCVFNAGASSYSPSIFIVQAKKLIPLLKPDLVVIDVDETDLYDEWYRYRDLVRRDEAGSVTAVRRSPVTSQFQRGLLESTNRLFYLHRLMAKLYFTEVVYPALYAEHVKENKVPGYMSAVPESEARKSYADQIAYFTSSLDDLTRSVIRLTGRSDRLVYVHHPYLQHLQDGAGKYNSVVSQTLRDVASRHGARYYDATDDLKVRFGNDPGSYYIPHDVHFNQAGQRVYGIAVAKYLALTTGDFAMRRSSASQ
jgi:hypothetical protein